MKNFLIQYTLQHKDDIYSYSKITLIEAKNLKHAKELIKEKEENKYYKISRFDNKTFQPKRIKG